MIPSGPLPLGSIMQQPATPRQRPQGGPGRAVLAEFLTKLLRLAALRLSDLCERLSFSPLDKADVLSQVRFAGTWRACLRPASFLIKLRFAPELAQLVFEAAHKKGLLHKALACRVYHKSCSRVLRLSLPGAGVHNGAPRGV